MKWLLVTYLLFVIAYASATTNSTTSTTNATEQSTESPKDSSQTYPYRISRGYNDNTNNYNNPYKSRFFDIPNPAPGSSLFNTSLAFTIPLFSINTKALTGRSLIEPLDGLKYGAGFPPLGSGVVAGLAIPALVAGILILLFDVFSRPFLMNNVSGRASEPFFSGGFGGIAEYILTFAENSLDHLPSIDGEECIKRSVCEAHSNPKKYGIIALPLQLLFPPYPYSGTDDRSKISKYQLAARYGKNEHANCGAQYQGCIINPLELISSLASMITDI